MEQEHKPEVQSWTSRAVSWGQLVIAIVTLFGALFVDRINYEKRLVTLEEQNKYFAVALVNEANQRSEVSRKLDSIQIQLNQLIVSVATIQVKSIENTRNSNKNKNDKND